MSRAKERHTVMYRVHPRVQIGVEYNPGDDELNPIGNAILNIESDTEPHLSFGTSSDRIGTPEGFQCYYFTAAKSFSQYGIGAYISFNYSEFEEGINLPFGFSYHIRPEISAMYMNDGRKSHGLLTYSQQDWSVSLMWVWFKHPGISMSWGF